MVRRLFSVIFLSALASACGGENTSSDGDVSASACGESGVTANGAWMRAASDTRPTSAIYVTLCNGEDVADALTGVTIAGVETVEIHETIETEDGLSSMVPIEKIDLPPGAPVTLKHGGAHIMLIGLTESFPAGGAATATLEFENAPSVEISVDIKEAMHQGGGH
ncbi:MAG: copper chaperone PCu(A)C [Pseudomonadota bacterium]